METTVREVLAFIRENDVKFVRLGFCDLDGAQKNMAVMADRLNDAFENGVAIDASLVPGFSDAAQKDICLYPDPQTLSVLPWRPGPGRVVRFYCDMKTPGGDSFWGDSRAVLKSAVENLSQRGYRAQIGTDCAFYLFKANENGDPTHEPMDRGSYMDIAPLDRGENIRREICLALEEMGLSPESSHHEKGPGQHKIAFQPGDALSAADHFLSFKACVKSVAARNGLYASFLPKPLKAHSASGLNINLSLFQNGQNLMQTNLKAFESFAAGIIAHAGEMAAILCPLDNSYLKWSMREWPEQAIWSREKRVQWARVPAEASERAQLELCAPDPSLNPYLAFALILSAGLEGIEKELTLSSEGAEKLPLTLYEALHVFESSSFAAQTLGVQAVQSCLRVLKNRAAFSDAQLFELI